MSELKLAKGTESILSLEVEKPPSNTSRKTPDTTNKILIDLFKILAIPPQ
jgi:hypothetical protein